jgi:hypothetical protein
MPDPPEIALAESNMFVQDVQASGLRDPNVLTHALGCNKRTSLDKSSRRLAEIALWDSSRRWAVFEFDPPTGETLAPLLHRSKRERFMTMHTVQFGSDIVSQ